MKKINPENERVKRAYLAYLKEAGRLSEVSVDQAAAAIDRFSAYNRQRSFKAFHIEQAVGFKRHLMKQVNVKTGAPLSNATLYAILMAVKNFFIWLADRPGYRSRIRYADAEYFNLSEKETRIAKTRREPRMPLLEQIERVVMSMPTGTAIERRDRTLVASTILTGARDAALASLKLRHVDVERGCVYQDAREVRTKFSKTITTFFFPVGDIFKQILIDWVNELRTIHAWGADDPLFPATRIEVGETTGQFETRGLLRQHWSTAAPVRRIFRQAFALADLPYFNPHSLRRTLASEGQRRCRSIEQLKAWSQNLGHDGVLTTLTSYGQIPIARQAELITKVGEADDVPNDAAELLHKIQELVNVSKPRASP
jgi:integrase